MATKKTTKKTTAKSSQSNKKTPAKKPVKKKTVKKQSGDTKKTTTVSLSTQFKKIFIGLTILIIMVITAGVMARYFIPSPTISTKQNKYTDKIAKIKKSAQRKQILQKTSKENTRKKIYKSSQKSSQSIPVTAYHKKTVLNKKTNGDKIKKVNKNSVTFKDSDVTRKSASINKTSKNIKPATQQSKRILPTFEVFPEDNDINSVPAKIIYPPIIKSKKPKVAIIIDDMGYDIEIAEKLLELDAELTFSMLPFSPFQKTISKKIYDKNCEIMLHLPMEPHQYPRIKPGPGALLTAMTPNQIDWQLAGDIAEVPYAVGVNNHMGSKMTERSEQLRQIFIVLKKKNLFFIDSRTTKDSRCRQSAKLLRLPFAERDVFLDHLQVEEAIQRQIQILIRKAIKNGSAIGIGHPHQVTYKVLKQELAHIKKRVDIIPASQLVKISE